MRLLLLFVTLLLISCDKEFMVQPELREYYSNFKVDARVRGIIVEDENLIITLKDINSDTKLGRYTQALGGQRYIYVDSASYYAGLGKLILYHELGHAILNRKHTKHFSLMNPNVTKYTSNLQYMDELNDELFTGQN